MAPIRRDFLLMGAAATAVAAAPRAFAAEPTAPGGGGFSFYEKGNIRIRYQEAGSGFPLLCTPGGGLNSRISNWPNAVINAMDLFKSYGKVERSAESRTKSAYGVRAAGIVLSYWATWKFAG